MATSERGGARRPAADSLLAKRTRAIFAPYPKALLGDVEAIHDLRVAARRARATLSLLAWKPGGKRSKRVERLLRDLARAAGRSRDLDVAAELMESLVPARGRTAKARATLCRSCAGERARRHALGRDALLDLDVAELRRGLRRIAAQATPSPGDLIERLQAVTSSQGAKIVECVATAGRRYDAEALHEIRRRARRLRYSAEIADDILGYAGAAAKDWRWLQTRLGDLHDRDVLSAWLAERAGRAERSGNPELASAARAAGARVARDARRLHRDYLAAGPAGLIARALEAMRQPVPAAEPPAVEPEPPSAVVIDFPQAAS